MKERLLTSPFEEQGKKTYLTEVIKREKKTNTAREKLELRYNAAVKAKESEVNLVPIPNFYISGPANFFLYRPIIPALDLTRIIYNSLIKRKKNIQCHLQIANLKHLIEQQFKTFNRTAIQ